MGGGGTKGARRGSGVSANCEGGPCKGMGGATGGACAGSKLQGSGCRTDLDWREGNRAGCIAVAKPFSFNWVKCAERRAGRAGAAVAGFCQHQQLLCPARAAKASAVLQGTMGLLQAAVPLCAVAQQSCKQ